jgi:hypothetical protein
MVLYIYNRRFAPTPCNIGVEAWAEEKSEGAAREITTNQQDQRFDLEVCRAWLFVALYSSGGPLSQNRSPSFYLITSTYKWFSLRGFLQGCLSRNLLCNVYGFCIYASAVIR